MSVLNFISRHDKDLLEPHVVFASMPSRDYQGGYYRPDSATELWFNGKRYTRARGLILINTDKTSSVEATLVHEWRHHWQFYNWSHKRNFESAKWPDRGSFEEKTIYYYMRYRRENDALRFEFKHARNS